MCAGLLFWTFQPWSIRSKITPQQANNEKADCWVLSTFCQISNTSYCDLVKYWCQCGTFGTDFVQISKLLYAKLWHRCNQSFVQCSKDVKVLKLCHWRRTVCTSIDIYTPGLLVALPAGIISTKSATRSQLTPWPRCHLTTMYQSPEIDRPW